MQPRANNHYDSLLEEKQQQIPQSVIAQISTNLPSKYKLSQPVTLDLSTLTDQLNLNEMIKQLLQEEKADDERALGAIERATFEFLVADKVLRGNLKSHFIRYQIGTQSTIKIQYFIAFEKFEEGDTEKMNDWIAALDLMQFNEGRTFIKFGVVCGMYDGSLRINHDCKEVTEQKNKLTFQADSEPIKAIKVIPAPEQNNYFVISGGLSEQVRISMFNFDKNTSRYWSLEGLNAHDGTILNMDINPMIDGHFCTSGSEGALNIWKIPEDFMEQIPEVKLKNKKKKQANLRKANFITSEKFSSESILSSKWATTQQILLGCSDHSIKFIDVQKMTQIKSMLTKDSITSGLDFSTANNIMVSSHQDGFIRGWDLRSNGSSPVNTFKGHTRYVSCIQFSPQSPNIFASGAYDSKINIWDFRSIFPLQTIQSQYEKIFAVQWRTEKNLVFGGSRPTFTSYTVF